MPDILTGLTVHAPLNANLVENLGSGSNGSIIGTVTSEAGGQHGRYAKKPTSDSASKIRFTVADTPRTENMAMSWWTRFPDGEEGFIQPDTAGMLNKVHGHVLWRPGEGTPDIWMRGYAGGLLTANNNSNISLEIMQLWRWGGLQWVGAPTYALIQYWADPGDTTISVAGPDPQAAAWGSHTNFDICSVAGADDRSDMDEVRLYQEDRLLTTADFQAIYDYVPPAVDGSNFQQTLVH